MIARVIIEDEPGLARLFIPGSLDPAYVTTEGLVKLARQNTIAVDRDVEAIIADAVKSFHGHPQTIDRVIAERRDPVRGDDGWLEWMEGYRPDTGFDRDAAGPVDHYNRIHYVKVAPETHVATVHPPTSGQEGRDVSGRAIRPEPGKPCDLKIDRTLDVRAGRVLTRGAGVLEFADRTLRVSRLFEVARWVDFTTGNIDFDGTVAVREGIRDRFAVRATEAIVVEGLVQSARVECGGNLVVKRGIAGRERGQLTVGGSLEAGYLEYARGTVAGDLVVAREIVNCRLDVGGELRAERAVVIGGDSTFRYSAHAGRLGNPAEKATTLVVGRIALLGRIERLLARLTQQHGEFVEQHGEPPPPEPDRPFARSRRGVRGAEDRIRDLQMRIRWCREQQAALAAAADAIEVVVEVGTVIDPGVRLLVGPYEVNVRTALSGPLRIEWLHHDEPHLATGGASPRPLAQFAETHLRAHQRAA